MTHSLEQPKPLRQGIPKRLLFRIGLRMDAKRRQLFRTWFNGAPLKGDRAKLMELTGLSKGRVTQLLDNDETFGERAARTLAVKLGLPATKFEPASGAWPFEQFKEEMWESLSEREKGRIEKAMLDELSAILGESQRKPAAGRR